MTPSPSSDLAAELATRLERVGNALGAREAAHRDELSGARARAETLHCAIAAALQRFHQAASRSGAPHLRVDLSEIRTDDKHLRAVEFEVTRGRYKAIVTAKSRGEITLVGPFHVGKAEGPCLTFPFGADAELQPALSSFLERFLEEAATP
jgi:hypothetical protein